MASQKRMMSTGVAIVATLMISVPSLSSAQDSKFEAPATAAAAGDQAPRRGEAVPEYTPAPGAKDLKSVLFNWAWYTGMLRSTEERRSDHDARL